MYGRARPGLPQILDSTELHFFVAPRMSAVLRRSDPLAENAFRGIMKLWLRVSDSAACRGVAILRGRFPA
jgi:hypothetical protein